MDRDYAEMQSLGAIDRRAANVGYAGLGAQAANQTISVPQVTQLLSLAEQLSKMNYSNAGSAEALADRLFGGRPESEGIGTDRSEPSGIVPLIESALRDAIRHAERTSAELSRIERQIA